LAGDHKFSSLPEPAILGLVEGMSIRQVDLALRLLDEADDREKTHKNFEKLRRAQARRGGLIHFVLHFWSEHEAPLGQRLEPGRRTVGP
jgi:hypothetical protein